MAASLGEVLLAALGRAAPVESRLDETLRVLATRAGAQECHLYLRPAAVSRYHLERSCVVERSAMPHSAEAGAADVGWGKPPLEVELPGGSRLQTIPTPGGQMTALGLVLETTDQMLLLGGSGRELSRSAKKELVRAADAIAVVLAQLRKEQRLEREAVAARTGTETSHRLALSAVDLDEFIRLLLELAMSATRSEGGFVAVADDQGTLRVSSVAGVAGQLAPGLDLGRDSGLFDWQATAPGAPLIVRDAAAAERLGIRSLLAAPIERGNAPVGVFALMTVTRRAEFDADTMRLLSSFVDQVGLMLESTKTFERFTQQFLLVLEGISRAVDARRPGPHSYHQLTGRLADEIGTLLGMSPEAAGDLRRAGQVHDVGLAALPASRDSYLVDVEHPQVAAGLLSTLPVRTSIVEAVRSHHEWYDGWGFPSGLAGEEIPLTGRILAVAAFAADLAVGNGLTPAWEWSRIAEEIRVRSGKQFDPRVVDLAVPLIESLPSVAEMA